MRFAKVYSAQPVFLDAHIVSVEADLSKGLQSFTVVGLPDKAVEESRDRVSSAVKHTGYEAPKSKARKIVVSLAPADLKKEGPLFDVPMALAYLLAAKEVRFDAEEKVFVGELALDGTLRTIRGMLAIARRAKAEGFKELYVPKGNAAEAALVEGVRVYGVESLAQLVAHLDAKREERTELTPQPQTKVAPSTHDHTIDFADIRGQELAKRGLMIAAAGRHNIVLYGPPGTGKTMLARAFCSILPPLSFEEALETTTIHSLMGPLAAPLITSPPFRAPHHSASHVALVGGGTNPRPGEVTLAHRGVLFLDEFPEFERRVIDALRQPLEDNVVSVSRARGSVVFPADFILVAAMNPSRAQDARDDVISERDRQRFQRKISGPIIDRIDMWIEVAHIDHAQLSGRARGERSERIREQVVAARTRQGKRYRDERKTNGDLSVKELDEHIALAPSVRDVLNASARTLELSPRAYHRVIKLARTIADLEGAEDIAEAHLLEALQYRPRNVFG